MKKLFLALLFLLMVTSTAMAYTQPVIIGYDTSAHAAVGITVNTANIDRCRYVFIGTTQSLDFSFDGTTWITFKGATAGFVIPLQAVGVRLTAGGAAPAAGDVVFLY